MTPPCWVKYTAAYSLPRSISHSPTSPHHALPARQASVSTQHRQRVPSLDSHRDAAQQLPLDQCAVHVPTLHLSPSSPMACASRSAPLPRPPHASTEQLIYSVPRGAATPAYFLSITSSFIATLDLLQIMYPADSVCDTTTSDSSRRPAAGRAADCCPG